MKFRVLFALALVPFFVLAQGNRPDGLQDQPEYIAANSFIFVFGDHVEGHEVPGLSKRLANENGAQVRHTYSHAIRGFSATIPEHAAERLAANNPNIAYYVPNGVAYVMGSVDEIQVGKGRPGSGGGAQTTPWGISRVNGGVSSNGTAWVIDTGIDFNHADLNVDVARSANFVARGKDSAADGNGHGTHVAGTIAAIDNDIDVVGVAAGATVVAVRVLDNGGSGTWDGVIAGIDYVAANASSGDVANMSLGGPSNQAVDDAVLNAARTCAFVLAAGNDGAHAGNSSPAGANAAGIYTISATASNDALTSWSNYGMPPVDWAEPGSSILSTKKGGGTTSMSGTSMAAPHAAGLLLIGNIRNGGSTSNSDRDGDRHPIGIH